MVHWKVDFELDLEGSSIEYYVESINEILALMSSIGYGEVRNIVDVNAQKVLHVNEVLESSTG